MGLQPITPRRAKDKTTPVKETTTKCCRKQVHKDDEWLKMLLTFNPFVRNSHLSVCIQQVKFHLKTQNPVKRNCLETFGDCDSTH